MTQRIAIVLTCVVAVALFGLRYVYLPELHRKGDSEARATTQLVYQSLSEDRPIPDGRVSVDAHDQLDNLERTKGRVLTFEIVDSVTQISGMHSTVEVRVGRSGGKGLERVRLDSPRQINAVHAVDESRP